MGVRDEYPTLRAVERLGWHRNPLVRELARLFDEADRLRTRTGAADVIEQHRAELVAARADADALARAIRLGESSRMKSVLRAHDEAITERLHS